MREIERRLPAPVLCALKREHFDFVLMDVQMPEMGAIGRFCGQKGSVEENARSKSLRSPGAVLIDK